MPDIVGGVEVPLTEGTDPGVTYELLSPPIPYEVAVYQTWHRRRVLEVKPGITGLWQVTGRSRTKFDEMVRLDLRYAESWTLWRDIKILLRTPLAVIKGAGAY